MERRRFLGTLAASLPLATGCLDAPSAARYGPRAFDGHTTSTEREVQRILSVESQDSVAEEHELEIAVEMLEPEITDDHPARVRVTTTNEGAPRNISISEGGCSLFNRRDSGSDDPRGLWLERRDPGATTTPVDGRWTLEVHTDGRGGFPDYGCAGHDYQRGESVVNEYVVLDDPSVLGYFVENVYRFEQPVSVAPIASERDDPEQPIEFTWGFSLRVEEP